MNMKMKKWKWEWIELDGHTRLSKVTDQFKWIFWFRRARAPFPFTGHALVISTFLFFSWIWPDQHKRHLLTLISLKNISSHLSLSLFFYLNRNKLANESSERNFMITWQQPDRLQKSLLSLFLLRHVPFFFIHSARNFILSKSKQINSLWPKKARHFSLISLSIFRFYICTHKNMN